jgi:hypothetical protein
LVTISNKPPAIKKLDHDYDQNRGFSGPKLSVALKRLSQIFNDVLGEDYGVKAYAGKDMPPILTPEVGELTTLIYSREWHKVEPTHSATTMGQYQAHMHTVSIQVVVGNEAEEIGDMVEKTDDLGLLFTRAVNSNSYLPDEEGKSQLLMPMQLVGGVADSMTWGVIDGHPMVWRTCRMSLELLLEHWVEGPNYGR